jgi:nucleotide-binding universal stress UspA family protein
LTAESGPRNILVAVDGSENALKAAHYGAMLAEKFGSRLTLAYVLQSQEYFSGFLTTSSKTANSILDSYYSKAREKAMEWISNLASDLAIKGAKPETQILSDQDTSIVGAILEYAEKSGINLIVVGSRGLGGFKKLVLGSVSQGIINHAKCSVLVVR